MLQLVPLSFPYDALEPHIDAATMKVHHAGHLKAYVDKTNDVLSAMRTSDDEIAHEIAKSGIDVAMQRLPDVANNEWRQSLRNNGGGVLNHELFFASLAPSAPTGRGGAMPVGADVAAAIETWFGGFSNFQALFRASALTVFGSGWVFLELDCRQLFPTLNITAMAGQDTPATDPHRFPLLPLDVWEHAYYLKHQNKRSEFIEEWWSVVDWHVVDARYRRAIAAASGLVKSSSAEL